jgi:hypothetical protein
MTQDLNESSVARRASVRDDEPVRWLFFGAAAP